jgi:hypothetical protein
MAMLPKSKKTLDTSHSDLLVSCALKDRSGFAVEDQTHFRETCSRFKANAPLAAFVRQGHFTNEVSLWVHYLFWIAVTL